MGRRGARRGACGVSRVLAASRLHVVLNSLSLDFIAVSAALLGEGGADHGLLGDGLEIAGLEGDAEIPIEELRKRMAAFEEEERKAKAAKTA